jgi:hypothetical protein
MLDKEGWCRACKHRYLEIQDSVRTLESLRIKEKAPGYEKNVKRDMYVIDRIGRDGRRYQGTHIVDRDKEVWTQEKQRVQLPDGSWQDIPGECVSLSAKNRNKKSKQNIE